MSEINDGGPAFARPMATTEGGIHEHQHIDYGHPGMSLRDWFAGHAMQGMMASSRAFRPSVTARKSYELADAMLKAREVKS